MEGEKENIQNWQRKSGVYMFTLVCQFREAIQLFFLPIFTYYLLPITHNLLPITYYPLPITYYLLPITYELPITKNYPLPIT